MSEQHKPDPEFVEYLENEVKNPFLSSAAVMQMERVFIDQRKKYEQSADSKMLPVAQRKIRQMGGETCGVLVRNEAGIMAVTDLGCVTKLDDAVMGPVDRAQAVELDSDDSRTLSSLGDELHNLGCEINHTNEDWAEQIAGIAIELWGWNRTQPPSAGVPDRLVELATEEISDAAASAQEGGEYEPSEWASLVLSMAAPQPQSADVVNKDALKVACTDFFYWWYSAPGSNTQQGFDEWFAEVGFKHFDATTPQPAGSPDAYCVIEQDGRIGYTVMVREDGISPDQADQTARRFCHDHINDCAGHGVEGAGEWIVRPLNIGGLKRPQPPREQGGE